MIGMSAFVVQLQPDTASVVGSHTLPHREGYDDDLEFMVVVANLAGQAAPFEPATYVCARTDRSAPPIHTFTA